MRVTTLLLAAGALAGTSTSLHAADPDKTALAAKAKAVLQTHCYRCHGKDGSVEGAMNYVADLAKLVARKKVVPGDPEASRLFRRVDDGTMPPPDEQPRPNAAEVAVLKQWIEAGSPPDTASTTTARKAITTADVSNFVLADLEAMDRRTRRFQRYFTLAPLHNAGLSDEELQTYRNALAKLVNSLSWSPRVTLPVAVDPARTVLRIDLRWYLWDAATWNRILVEYPYGVLDDGTASRAVMVGTAARVPVIRADWFVGTASRAPLYYDVLQFPSSLTELERQLRVDAVANIQQERVVRVGFNGSGVSRFNRVLERHDSAQGVYWRSYDFDEPPANLIERGNGNLLPDRRNVFAFPLGPGLVAEPFQHAGGEAIFTLPNGLHAYYIAKSENTRLDKAPVAIVSDPKRPDRAVEAGVSCMSCHVTGILPKADQIRDHLDKNPKAFSRGDASLIRALYPPKEKSLALMQEDAKRYAEAVAKTGAKVSKFEAVSTITLKYEADLDLPAAAAEIGLAAEDFRERITKSETLTKHVGALRPAGGTLTRALWVQAFGDVVRELRLGTLFQANLNGATLADNTGEVDPLESRDVAANAIAFSADGRLAVVAPGDRSARIYEVEGRRDLRRLVGHTASVWAVALSADGKMALTGSMDGTARVWDVASGQELKRFAGHDSLVSAVAFTPDGRWAVSGGFDGVVALWKARTGEEIRRWEGVAKYVTAVAVDPDGKTALIAADRSLYLWDLNTGETHRRFDGHTAPVGCVAFADAARVVSGSDDGSVRVWDIATGKPLAALTGHVGVVRGVAVKPGGRWLLTAGADRTVRLWDLRSWQEAAAFRKHAAAVVGAAFLANGTQTVSGDRELVVLPWKIDRFLSGEAPKPPPVVPKAPDVIPYAKP
jgi:WD40 repeat protein/mono/diheme cytochrome c family protein